MRALGELAALSLRGAEHDVSEDVRHGDDDELDHGQGRLLGDHVLSDQGGQEGEGHVGEEHGESKTGVHGVVGEEVVLFEEHGIGGVDDLEGGGHQHGVVDGSALAEDRVGDQEDVQHGQADHGDAECLQFDVGSEEVRVEFSSVDEVDDEVAGVALGVGVSALAPVRQEVAEGRHEHRQDDAGGHQVEVVVGDEGEAHLTVDHDRHDGQHGQQGEEAVELDLIAADGAHACAQRQEGEGSHDGREAADGQESLLVPIVLDVLGEFGPSGLAGAALAQLVQGDHDQRAQSGEEEDLQPVQLEVGEETLLAALGMSRVGDGLASLATRAGVLLVAQLDLGGQSSGLPSRSQVRLGGGFHGGFGFPRRGRGALLGRRRLRGSLGLPRRRTSPAPGTGRGLLAGGSAHFTSGAHVLGFNGEDGSILVLHVVLVIVVPDEGHLSLLEKVQNFYDS